MALAVERRDDGLWLVAYEHPGDPQPDMLARFANEECVRIFRDEIAQAMKFAREVGRSGLG
jgi:hypothetical protein